MLLVVLLVLVLMLLQPVFEEPSPTGVDSDRPEEPASKAFRRPMECIFYRIQNQLLGSTSEVEARRRATSGPWANQNTRSRGRHDAITDRRADQILQA